KQAFIITESLEQSSERTISFQDQDTGEVTDASNAGIPCGTSDDRKPCSTAEAGSPYRSVMADKKHKEPLKQMPLEARFGFAWFASPKLLVATDVIYHGETNNGNDEVETYDREAVTDLALGAEYFVSPSW